MSPRESDQPRLSREDRDDLAFQALGAERRNHPRGLLVLAAGALGIAAIYFIFSVTARQDAGTSLAAQRSQLGTVKQLAGQLEALERASEGGDQAGLGAPIPGVLQRLQATARRANLEASLPRENETRRQDALQKRYQYTLTHGSLDDLMRFVNLVLDEIPGMEVYSVDLRPSGARWTLDVTFARWERAS